MSISRLIHFAGNTVRFSLDNERLLAEVDTHFKNCLGEGGPIIADYKITTVGDVEFSISLNGSDLFSKINFEQVLFYLMQDGITQLNGTSTTNLIFHAAALSCLDRGLILCGKSGSGKSSLTAWLTANSLQYLTDEVISLPVDGGEISGLCRSMILKRGSAFIWQHWLTKTESDGFLRFNDGSAWIAPTLLNASAVRDKVMPRILIFPHYVEGAQFQAQPLTPANTLFQLLQCLVNARNFPDYGMTATKQLSRQVSAFSLTYSDIEIATQWIKQTTAG
ncbi:MAG: hypothetical protein HY863_03915 [Chloroflexi bacterium]|nr:hypothetical protein [Chloroflexota bacterium]